MIALVRYHLASLLHTQRYLAPLLLFVSLVCVLTTGNGELASAYAACAGALFVSATWLTLALLGVDAPEQRAVVVVAAGGRSGRVLLAAVLAVLVSCVPLLTLGLLLPLGVGRYEATAADAAWGLLAQLTCACTGVGIGTVCSRLVFRRHGYGLVAAVVLLLTTLLARGMPPVNRLCMLVYETPDGAARLLAPAGALLAVAVAALAACTAATHLAADRRT